MMARRPKVGGGKAHQFGGDWTSAKLDVIAKYLRAYTTALKNQPSKERPFRKIYVDAFAGTGYREAQRDDETAGGQQGLLLPDLAGDEPQAFLDGSARLALKTEPRFDRYVFIERSPSRCARLEELKGEFAGLADGIEIRQGDANAEIQKFCTAEDWRSSRAVLFLDPYGMQVEWATLEAIAGTKAIDMWLLFPLGIGVNRLLKKSGDIPEPWRRKLNLLLGTEDWYEEFYRVEAELTLFGDSSQVVKASTETIGRYFNERLKSIFPAVAEKPQVLVNSQNNPLYLLCFAVGNARGAPVALRIATHLLKDSAG